MHTEPTRPVLDVQSQIKTHFPIVPIEQVPVPEASGGAGVDRPIVLVVEDDTAVADTLVEILNQNGYTAIAAVDCADAVETALLVPPDVVIADVALRGMSGIEVANVLRSKFPEVKIVLSDGDKAVSDPAFAVVEKPIQPAVLLEKISASLKQERKPV